jgi:hypothetical protein
VTAVGVVSGRSPYLSNMALMSTAALPGPANGRAAGVKSCALCPNELTSDLMPKRCLLKPANRHACSTTFDIEPALSSAAYMLVLHGQVPLHCLAQQTASFRNF